MPGDYTEQAFETAIEAHLLTRGGYTQADPINFDRDKILNPTILQSFIQETQPQTWGYLTKLLRDNTPMAVLDELGTAMDNRRALDIIRHGFKVASNGAAGPL
jgi:hypothetical protein